MPGTQLIKILLKGQKFLSSCSENYPDIIYLLCNSLIGAQISVTIKKMIQGTQLIVVQKGKNFCLYAEKSMPDLKLLCNSLIGAEISVSIKKMTQLIHKSLKRAELFVPWLKKVCQV